MHETLTIVPPAPRSIIELSGKSSELLRHSE
jgi:hypothetical protein